MESLGAEHSTEGTERSSKMKKNIQNSSISYVIGLESTIKSMRTKAIKPMCDFLKTNQSVYEITWPKTDEDLCRAFIDIDGLCIDETTEYDFTVLDEAILTKLCGSESELIIGTPYSVMTASKWQTLKDCKKINKLSYRLTFPKKCGSKNAVKNWTEFEILPKLQLILQDTIKLYNKKLDNDMKEDYINYDSSVYRSKGKLRCWNSTKPEEIRLNVLKKGNVEDTLINLITEECEILEDRVIGQKSSKKQTKTTTSEQPILLQTDDKLQDGLTEDQKLIISAMSFLHKNVVDDYETWTNVGMSCFNEKIPVKYWDDWSKQGSTYKAGECEKKWAGFRSEGGFTQAYIWYQLKLTNPIKFKELIKERKDFENLIEQPTHYHVAIYFYNAHPDDYLHYKKAWFGVMSNKTWEYTGEVPPATINNKISRFFQFECLQLENIINKKKIEAFEQNQPDVIERLDKKTQKILEFKKNTQTDFFIKGIISFLKSSYAEQAERLIIKNNIDASLGLLTLFDSNPNLFAFSNKVYDFTIKNFRDILPTDYITITCGYPVPQKNVQVMTEIKKVLWTIWEDTEVMQYLLNLTASCLNGTRNLEVFAILTGSGGNGKGLITTLIRNTFGGYYYELKTDCITKKTISSGGASPELFQTKGKRYVNLTEPEADDKLQEGLMKAWTGGDSINCRGLRQDPVVFKPQFGLFIQCNEIPNFNQITKGGLRRNRVIRFPFNFVAECKLSTDRIGDPTIKSQKCPSNEWRDAFFYILLESYFNIEGKQIDAIPTPDFIKNATDEYIQENNQVGVWWFQNFEVKEGHSVRSTDALERYKADYTSKIDAKTFKTALKFNEINIVMGSQGSEKGRMIIKNWALKPDLEANE